MPKIVQIWDLGAASGPAQISMASAKAREAMKRDPKRYLSDEPGPGDVKAYQADIGKPSDPAKTAAPEAVSEPPAPPAKKPKSKTAPAETSAKAD